MRCQHKFWYVKCDAFASTEIDIVDGLPDRLLGGELPQEGVINTLCFLREFCNDLIVTAGVTVTRGYVTLWGYAIPVPTPWCDKGGQVTIIIM